MTNRCRFGAITWSVYPPSVCVFAFMATLREIIGTEQHPFKKSSGKRKSYHQPRHPLPFTVLFVPPCALTVTPLRMTPLYVHKCYDHQSTSVFCTAALLSWTNWLLKYLFTGQNLSMNNSLIDNLYGILMRPIVSNIFDQDSLYDTVSLYNCVGIKDNSISYFDKK